MGTYIKIDTEPEVIETWMEGPTPNVGDILTFGSYDDRKIETYEVVSIHRAYRKSVRERGGMDLKGSAMDSPPIVLVLKKLYDRDLEREELRNLEFMSQCIPFSDIP